MPRTAVLLASPMPSTAPAAPPKVPSTTCVEMRPKGLPLRVLLLPLPLIVLLVEGVDGDWLPRSESCEPRRCIFFVPTRMPASEICSPFTAALATPSIAAVVVSAVTEMVALIQVSTVALRSQVR